MYALAPHGRNYKGPGTVVTLDVPNFVSPPMPTKTPFVLVPCLNGTCPSEQTGAIAPMSLPYTTVMAVKIAQRPHIATSCTSFADLLLEFHYVRRVATLCMRTSLRSASWRLMPIGRAYSMLNSMTLHDGFSTPCTLTRKHTARIRCAHCLRMNA